MIGMAFSLKGANIECLSGLVLFYFFGGSSSIHGVLSRAKKRPL